MNTSYARSTVAVVAIFACTCAAALVHGAHDRQASTAPAIQSLPAAILAAGDTTVPAATSVFAGSAVSSEDAVPAF